jgi:hypothetical protein
MRDQGDRVAEIGRYPCNEFERRYWQDIRVVARAAFFTSISATI